MVRTVWAALLILSLDAPALADAPEIARVVDGDTLELASGEHLRVLGVDTPETWHSRCLAEQVAGEAATAAVEGWIAGAATVQVIIDEDGHDRYGRLLGTVLLDGESLSTRLIAAGLGLPYDGGTRPDWCAPLP